MSVIPSVFSTRITSEHLAAFAALHSLMNLLCSEPQIFMAISSMFSFVSIEMDGTSA